MSDICICNTFAPAMENEILKILLFSEFFCINLDISIKIPLRLSIAKISLPTVSIKLLYQISNFICLHF